MGKSKILTEQAAKKIVSKFSEEEIASGVHQIADLTGFEAIEDAAAKVLVSVQTDMRIWAPDLKVLSESTAEILSTNRGDLCFGSLESISPQAAASLARTQCQQLHLQSLSAVSDEQGIALGSFTGSLLTLGFTSLSVPVAEALVRHKKCLHLNRIETLSDAAVGALSELGPSVWLSLDGLKEISDASAASLGRCESFLSLKGLENISPAAAQSLSRVQTLATSKEIRKIISKAKKSVTASGSKKTPRPKSAAGCPSSVFEWILGGVLAVRAPRKELLACLDKNGGKDWPWELVSGSPKGWSLLNGLNGFFVLGEEEGGQFISAALGCMAIHVTIDNGSGSRCYGIYDSGKLVEKCNHTLGSEESEDAEDLTFSSKIATLPAAANGNPEDFDRFLEIANKRFQDLGLYLPEQIK